MPKSLFIIALALLCCACSSSKKTSKSSTVSKSKYTSTTTKSSTTKSSGSTTSNNLSKVSQKLGIQVTTSDNQTLYNEAASWIGVPYKYGGTSRSGIDCSGLVYLMYQSVYSKTISRQSAAILENNCTRISKSNLRAGDLVFFRTDGKKTTTPNHVGIYLKNNKFIHASSSKGVVVSDLTTDYYVRNWITAGRVK